MAVLARVIANRYLFFTNYCNKSTVNTIGLRKFSGLSRHCLSLRRFRASISIAAAFSENKQASLNSSIKSQNSDEKLGTFEKLLFSRKNEANRSVIVQVQSPESYADLYSYCCEFGQINSIHHYVLAKNSYFFIIEFADIATRQALMDASTHLNCSEIIPVQSQMLWFRKIPKQKQKIMKDIPEMMKYTEKPNSETIMIPLSEAKSINEQIQILYESWKLDDIETRLRYFTAIQLESCFSSMFPNISVLPFGSSVNGFGRKGCDLDLVLSLELNKIENANSRLIFHTKSALSEERAQTQRSMEVISMIMKHFIPCITNVRKILRARVPIIKYDHKLTGLECDLSMTNMTAIYMSELLYLYGEINSNVRPLVFTIRQWAASVGITNASPGFWITNFSLSLMVLFYLQSKKILPPLNSLQNNAQTSDIRITDTCVNCTFVRDITKWPAMNTTNCDSLENLLSDFYCFYANYDFTTKAISLRDGKSIYKPDSSPLYICNPLEKTLNVSKNVNGVEITRFINATQNAMMLMNESNEQYSRGLLDIFAEKRPQQQFMVKRVDKKVRIADIFRTEENLNDEIQKTRSKKERAKRR
ncbi:hypothetical protein PV327_009384 [Microctonus hyperodae]|uniref:Poly(A) RNA polymerase mitochondrial-like central palm domain-containing protein n=1 Tax=Microctonus hyperodae TaxID=165561 RepID=A0AA39FTP4_MICHY|nr:hypothetical protein PV327_009384 [Microctonus hyperodae]